MRLAVCEDNALQREMLREQLEAYLKKRGEKESPVCFSAGEKLLEYVSCSGAFDVYFLDNHLPGISGMDTARALRDRGDTGRLIFLTATTEYAVESLSVDPFYYLLKPVDAETLEKLLDRAAEQTKEQEYVVRNKRQTVTLCRADIVYVDNYERAARYHLKNGRSIQGLKLRAPFLEALRELGEDRRFFPAGQSLLINLDRVESLQDGVLRMDEGSSLFPSRNALPGLEEALRLRRI